MRIGILHNSLGSDSLDTSFDRAASAGFEGVEIMYASSVDLASLSHASHVAGVKAAAERAHLAVPSLCMAFICRQPSLMDTPEEARTAMDAIRRGIEVAGEVGAGVVLLPFFSNSAIELEPEITRAADALAELADDAERANVILALETNLSFNRCRFLLDQVGNGDRVKVYYDTGNAAASKLDLPTGIRVLGRQAIGGIHFKDVRLAGGSPPEFNVDMGRGSVDFRAVVQALRAVQYDGWVMLETPPGDDPVKNAQANLAFTRELLKP